MLNACGSRHLKLKCCARVRFDVKDLKFTFFNKMIHEAKVCKLDVTYCNEHVKRKENLIIGGCQHTNTRVLHMFYTCLTHSLDMSFPSFNLVYNTGLCGPHF